MLNYHVRVEDFCERNKTTCDVSTCQRAVCRCVCIALVSACMCMCVFTVRGEN